MANACNPIIAPTKILIDLGRDSTAFIIASIVRLACSERRRFDAIYNAMLMRYAVSVLIFGLDLRIISGFLPLLSLSQAFMYQKRR